MAIFKGFPNSDFLSPNTIAKSTTRFINQNLGTVSSGNFSGSAFPGDPLGKNPNAKTILEKANSGIDHILSPDFGLDLFPPGTLPTDPLPAANNNPLTWRNPNAMNILLGITQVQGGLLSGGGLPFPPFNPFPAQQTVQFPFNSLPAYRGALSSASFPQAWSVLAMGEATFRSERLISAMPVTIPMSPMQSFMRMPTPKPGFGNAPLYFGNGGSPWPSPMPRSWWIQHAVQENLQMNQRQTTGFNGYNPAFTTFTTPRRHSFESFGFLTSSVRIMLAAISPGASESPSGQTG